MPRSDEWEDEQMRALAYGVQQFGPRSLQQVGTAIEAMPIEDRFFLGEDDGLRLENFTDLQGLWHFDFAKRRSGHGPGRMARERAMEEIDLGGDWFGEDTAFVFDPATGVAAVQYNHFGPRLKWIEQYLAAADLTLGGVHQGRWGFGFGMRLKDPAYAELQDFGLIQEIDFTVSVPGVRAANFERGNSLAGILNAPLPVGIETIRVEMKARADRGSSLGHDEAWGVINDLRRLGGDLIRADVWGKQDARSRRQRVNLKDAQISSQQPVNAAGNRVARTERYTALRAAIL
ncbi:MAG TPA: hypothetical protein DCX75_05650, partial [Brevundimonas sp.]|nr:hypothetical protein [Brevundimonas sp.]